MRGEIVGLAVALIGRMAKRAGEIGCEIGETAQLDRGHAQEANRLMHNPGFVRHYLLHPIGLSPLILADLEASRASIACIVSDQRR
jgi:hypothetical protein